MIPFFGYAIALLGFNLLFGYTGLLSFGHAMFLGVGAYGAAIMAGVLRREVVRAGAAHGHARRRALIATAGRLAVRALYRHLLRHADARFRHAVPLVPVQVLLPDRRRQRHARAAHEHPRAGVRALQQDRVAGRAVLLLLPRRCWSLAGLRDVADRAFAVRAAPAGDPRQSRARRNISACTCTAFRLAAFVISAGFGAVGGAILGFRVGLADPELVYWTQSGPARVHGGARRLREFLRADRRRARPSRCCRTSCNR